MATFKAHAVRLLAALALLLPCVTAHAGGLQLLDRGARPLSRGGAFVAGADDPGSLWYNPAGLAYSGNQVMGDFTLTFMFADFQRYNIAPDGMSARVEQKVEMKQMYLPIPTLAFSHNFGLKDFTFGAGIFAPNTILLNWPKTINGGRDPGPTRYSLLGLRGSILSNLALGFAYHGIKGLSIGADVQVALGRFKAETALSAYDGVACSFPEQAECDAYATLDVFPAVGISGVFGMIYNLGDVLKVGASVMLPYELKGTATLKLDLPSAAVFEDARLDGNKANFGMKFPMIVRVGGEIRPHQSLRMEGTFVWEGWSAQKEITLKPKDDIYLRNIVGITDYQVGDLAIPRKMNDVWSLRGGFEFQVPKAWQLASLQFLKLSIRGGLAYETSAFKKSTTTPLTLDSDKVMLSGGSSIWVHKRVRMDGVIGYFFMADPKVTNSTIKQPTAIRPAPQDVTALGNGKYNMDAFYLGGALVIKMD